MASSTTPPSAPSTSCRTRRTSSSMASSVARPRSPSTSGRTKHRSWCTHPPPADGAVDLLGYPLSIVATSGPDAPPLPANSGSGKRVVYDRSGQRVWAVDKNDRVIRSWLVAGSKYNNEVPGTHEVLQPQRGVDRVERQGLPAEDDPLAEDRHRQHRFPRHPASRQRRIALHEGLGAGSPAVGWLPASGRPRCHVHVGLRPGRYQSRRL